MHRTWIVLLLFTSFFAHGSSFVHLNGSGASFPEPIYQKWFKDFSYRDNDARSITRLSGPVTEYLNLSTGMLILRVVTQR